MKLVKKQTQKGFALLLALIVSSVVLAIGVSILNISINQINLSATARESEFAFQAAHAGIDCLWYWRYEDASAFKNSSLSAAPASLRCFDVPSNPVVATQYQLNANGHVNSYSYQFDWGEANNPNYPQRCTKATLYVMNASTGDLTHDFSPINPGVGDASGMKTCELGNLCTVIISSGYNRACNQIDSSIFSIQREIVVEF